MKPIKIDLMLDSGAFNAWGRGISLDLKKYITFIKRNQHLLYSYVCMDSIPGKKGYPRTLEQVRKSAKLSYDNLCRMRDAGLNPIPVFHQGESFNWLKQMLDDGETYIGLSRNMSKKSQRGQARVWLDRCFETIDKSKAKVKTHGFGITHHKLLARHPWFSADSTAWVIQSSYGHIFVPTFRNGEMDFKQPQRLKVSIRKSGSSYKPFGLLYPTERECVEKYLSDIGVDLFHISNLADTRQYANLLFFEGLAKQLDIKIFQSAALVSSTVELLNQVGITNRLLSYFDIMDYSTEDMEKHIRGEHKSPTKRIIKTDWKKQSYLNIRYANLIKRIKSEEHDAQN